MKIRSITFSLFVMVAVAITILSFKNAPLKENGFKNLKVLPKDITRKQLDSTMDYYCISLGVHCGACHARKDSTSRHMDFASDTKPEKGRAREMITMTADLNNHYFNQGNTGVGQNIPGITCYTCHRGGKEPTVKNLLPQVNALYEAAKEAERQARQKKQ